jgi:quinol monooxygenase YgiN
MSVKGEMYKSKSAMKKHEKSEGMKERMKEYGPKSVKAKKPTKAAPKKMVVKKGARRGK